MSDLPKAVSLFRDNGRYFEFVGTAHLFVSGGELGDVAVFTAADGSIACEAEQPASAKPDPAMRKMIVSVIEDAIARGELKW